MIIARTRGVDGYDQSLDLLVALREAPFPGDTIKLVDHRIVRVLRRQFIELDPDNSDDKVDVVLDVRIA